MAVILPTTASVCTAAALAGSAAVAAGVFTAYTIQGTGWCFKKVVGLFRKEKAKADDSKVEANAPSGAPANA